MENSIDINKLRMINRGESKNSDDIYDLSTFEEIMKELDCLKPNIEERFEAEIEGEKLKLLDEIRSFARQASDDFKKGFIKLVEDYRNQRGEFSQRMIKHIEDKSFDLPTFKISDGLEAEKALEDMGFEEEFEEDAFLVSFQLPKPLANFWWKGGNDPENGRVRKTKGSAVEWRYFYQELMPIIWAAKAEFEDERGLYFRRINDLGEHDPQKYYYIWKVGRWSELVDWRDMMDDEDDEDDERDED